MQSSKQLFSCNYSSHSYKDRKTEILTINDFTPTIHVFPVKRSLQKHTSQMHVVCKYVYGCVSFVFMWCGGGGKLLILQRPAKKLF